MSKNLEIESKTLLDKETYEKMRAAFTANLILFKRIIILIHQTLI